MALVTTLKTLQTPASAFLRLDSCVFVRFVVLPFLFIFVPFACFVVHLHLKLI